MQCVKFNGIYREKEYNTHKYVLISVKLHKNEDHCIFVTFEYALYFYTGSESSSMLHHSVSTVAQNGQTQHWHHSRASLSCFFVSFTSTICYSTRLEGFGEGRDIQSVTICNLTAIDTNSSYRRKQLYSP